MNASSRASNASSLHEFHFDFLAASATLIDASPVKPIRASASPAVAALSYKSHQLLWSHFDRAPKMPQDKDTHHRAICHYCGHQLSGQQQRMKRHLLFCEAAPVQVSLWIGSLESSSDAPRKKETSTLSAGASPTLSTDPKKAKGGLDIPEHPPLITTEDENLFEHYKTLFVTLQIQTSRQIENVEIRRFNHALYSASFMSLAHTSDADASAQGHLLRWPLRITDGLTFPAPTLTLHQLAHLDLKQHSMIAAFYYEPNASAFTSSCSAPAKVPFAQGHPYFEQSINLSAPPPSTNPSPLDSMMYNGEDALETAGNWLYSFLGIFRF